MKRGVEVGRPYLCPLKDSSKKTRVEFVIDGETINLKEDGEAINLKEVDCRIEAIRIAE